MRAAARAETVLGTLRDALRVPAAPAIAEALLLALLLALLWDRAPASTGDALRGSRVTGVLVGPDGRPAADATVRLTCDGRDRVTAVTDSVGRFTLRVPDHESGPFRLVSDRAGSGGGFRAELDRVRGGSGDLRLELEARDVR